MFWVQCRVRVKKAATQLGCMSGLKKPPAEINVVVTLDVDRGTADIL